jgi:outer membrane cobalamin receptor
LKNSLLYIVIFFSLNSFGQLSLDSDTVKIREVIISSRMSDSDPAVYKKNKIDTILISTYSNRNLSDLLSETTGIFIKSYGIGGIATPSFRGTGASHTMINWNGININSPMLGQSDLSLFPVGLADDIEIWYGGASMQLNNGGIGGTINIETKPDWIKKTLLSANSSVGSFGRYSGLIKVRTGTSKIESVTKGFFLNSENNFRYLNTVSGSEPLWQTRTNNQVRQKGFIQELYYNTMPGILSARVWYQASERNIPGSMLTLQPNSGESQFDESFRTIMNYDFSRRKSNLSVTAAWVLNRLNYLNHLASIDSKNLSETLTLKASFENQIGESTKLKIVLDEQNGAVKSNNYYDLKRRNTASITASIDRLKDKISLMLLLREIIDRQHLLIPDFSSGARLRLFDGNDYFLKASISRNSKIPTMNDLFWIPGGNPELKNEYAMIYELTYEMTQKITDPLDLKYDLSAFRYSIKDMIQWHPGEYAYWTADNIQSVNSTGIESSLSLNYVQNKLNTGLKAGYSFTRAISGGPKLQNDATIGKQLIYIPENQINGSFRLRYGCYYATWIADFTGKRYITADNTRYLPGYFVNNLITGIGFPLKGSSIDISFTIDNLFNEEYQSMVYYPLPGRSYSIKIFIQLVK